MLSELHLTTEFDDGHITIFDINGVIKLYAKNNDEEKCCLFLTKEEFKSLCVMTSTMLKQLE